MYERNKNIAILNHRLIKKHVLTCIRNAGFRLGRNTCHASGRVRLNKLVEEGNPACIYCKVKCFWSRTLMYEDIIQQLNLQWCVLKSVFILYKNP